MAEQKPSDDNKLLKQAISAFVSITHIIAFFQIVICSRHLAVAFDIPPKNIGIYFAKLYSLRSLLMSAGCGVEYGIYRIGQSFYSDKAKEVRGYLSIVWFVLLTICEVSFLCVLYFSKRVAFHNYIVLNLEGMFFGFFQMSIISLIPEFASFYILSLYVSGTCIFIIQTIIDKCTKNSMLSVKIQSWICVICSLICLGIWPVRLIVLKDSEQSSTTGGTDSSQTSCNGQQGVESSPAGGGGGGGGSGSSSSSAEPPLQPRIEYLITMSSITILKIMSTKLDEACSGLNPQSVMNVQILITRLQQITREQDISYDILVAIDLVILSLKKCQCSEDKLFLLAELSLFLRIKVLVKTEQTQVTQVSDTHGHSHLPVSPLLYLYPGYVYPHGYLGSEDIIRAKRGATERTRKRKRRNASKGQGCQNGGKGEGSEKNFFEHLLSSLSPLMMFGTGSLVKDFLFPGVIPYGLLERDKCHLINLIVIIFLSVGPVTIFVLSLKIDDFKNDVKHYHWFWISMIPKTIIFIISLSAIHTKQSCTHKIRSSQAIVLFMTVVLLTCYGFLETMSFVGMGYYVKLIAKDPKLTDLQAIQNVSGKFFRYFVYKLSVGYNGTRNKCGFTLPNFKPPEPIPNTFCYWFKGAFRNGWIDIKSDFKFNIKQYLTVTEEPIVKSVTILTSLYPDLLR